ncbi:MAG: hypothetical protein RLZZ237_476 [Pseudomonadota bacterium]
MAEIKMQHTDVVIVGFGWTGAIMAKELSDAGLRVVALERGVNRDLSTDDLYPGVIDELTYGTRGKLFQNLSRETVTIRHAANGTAVPYRQLHAFLPGDGVGGAGLHWGGVHFRVSPDELRIRSHYTERYGKKFIPEGMTAQDFGITYDELEPYFDFAEKVFGTSGVAYTVKGKVVGKGNVFAPDRSHDFPLPPMPEMYTGAMFRKAASDLGFHPYPIPSADAGGPYTNPYGAQMGPCNLCGFCSGYVCYNSSRASPNLNILPALKLQPLFELRTRSTVQKINLDSTRSKATGVTYIDASGRSVEQTADMVLVCSFAYNNVRLLLLSEIGQPYDPVSGTGVVGKNFTYQNVAKINLQLDQERYTNSFIGSDGAGVAIDDFNADHFDHGPLGFVGGSAIWSAHGGNKPIAAQPIRHGAPQWGSGWKKELKQSYLHSTAVALQGSCMAYRDCYLDLDPTYRDVNGLPLLRMTFDWKDNDTRMMAYVGEQAMKIARALEPVEISSGLRKPGAHFDTRTYQTTHLNGGAIMGSDPSTSVVNKYLQVWQVPNLFVHGASAFPNGLAYNPTGLVAALTYYSAAAIKAHYLKSPHQLIAG